MLTALHFYALNLGAIASLSLKWMLKRSKFRSKLKGRSKNRLRQKKRIAQKRRKVQKRRKTQRRKRKIINLNKGL